jgi:hypothetical protein
MDVLQRRESSAGIEQARQNWRLNGVADSFSGSLFEFSPGE